MLFLRILILAVVIALGTVMVAWWTVPIAGVIYGLVTPGSKRPGLTAALAGVIAWGGYLAIAAMTGAPLGAFASRLAQAMQLPGWAPMAATLLFPAILAGCGAVLGAAVTKPTAPASRRFA